MKQLIGLVRLSALTAFSVALFGAHRQTQATQTTQTTHNHHSKKPDLKAEPQGELVLLGWDGTVIAREVNLAPHGR
jgi:hypothetical protein